jgi:hypothetical protein
MAMRVTESGKKHIPLAGRCCAAKLQFGLRRLGVIFDVFIDVFASLMSASAPQAPKRDVRARSVAFGRTPVIPAPTPRLEIIRDELADYEWVAITPMLPSKPYGRAASRPLSSAAGA